MERSQVPLSPADKEKGSQVIDRKIFPFIDVFMRNSKTSRLNNPKIQPDNIRYL